MTARKAEIKSLHWGEPSSCPGKCWGKDSVLKDPAARQRSAGVLSGGRILPTLPSAGQHMKSSPREEGGGKQPPLLLLAVETLCFSSLRQVGCWQAVAATCGASGCGPRPQGHGRARLDPPAGRRDQEALVHWQLSPSEIPESQAAFANPARSWGTAQALQGVYSPPQPRRLLSAGTISGRYPSILLLLDEKAQRHSCARVVTPSAAEAPLLLISTHSALLWYIK